MRRSLLRLAPAGRGGRGRRTAAATLALAAGLSLPVSAALAAAPSQQGWWWAASSELVPVGTPTPADVPPDGLLVEGGPQGPIAYAGLVYFLEPGEVPETLTLTVAPGSATAPDAQLSVCPLQALSVPEQQGGSIADAPAYKCTTAITAGAAEDGASYTFGVRSLVQGDVLAVAVLPVEATDRVVFAKPGEDSLAVVAGATTSVGGEPAPEGADGMDAPAAADLGGFGSAQTDALPPLPLGEVDQGPVPGVADLPEVAAEAPAPAPAAVSQPGGPVLALAGGAAEEGGPRWLLVLPLLTVVAAAGLWLSAGAPAAEGAAPRRAA